ncbi:hypothetical protein B0T17DRAFT_83086 [Bombardia bombarda]|uniref:Uncharacterized protein n=1 Tax=Bombardia bombarda TaxID=252184 RepID=A0AA39XLZ4_9PEZI|nr:hypothetical protein B0T17DRAFT_83086 [Bombardia bombarda]
MSGDTVYLVTGANRGIGLAITTLLVRRPHTIVVATSRKQHADDLNNTAADAHETSKIVPVLLDEQVPALSSATLPGRLLAEHGIARLDVVIANAGGSSGFKSILETDMDQDLLYDFSVNAVGPAKLFRAVWPLLLLPSSAAGGSETVKGGKKFVLVTSSVGSIGALEEESMPTTAYGMSKAAANWFARKLSVEFRDRGLLVGIVHPGWVKTAMGQAVADAVHFKEPPLGVEESAQGVVEQIDDLTPETSGQFLTYNGQPLPW